MAEKGAYWDDIVALLREEAEKTAASIEEGSEAKAVAETLRASLSFLDQVSEWVEKLPQERIQASIHSFIRKLDSDILDAVKEKKISPNVYGGSVENPTAPFVRRALTALGPDIVVSSDKMKVHLTIDPDYAKVWSVDLVKEGLNRLGLEGTVSDQGIERAIQKPGKTVLIVKGQPPASGKDAVLEDCLGLDLDGIPSIIDRNRVDLKSLNWVHNVAVDQEILRKKPATLGVPGCNVYGEEIPCRDGVDFPFPSVTNTSLSEDGLSLLSAVDGCAYKEGDRLVVVPTLEIKENVDYSTGHITAQVAVNINGDVLSGFKVESNEDIHVKGTVEASRLSAKGSIFLPGGVQGKSEAVIVSEKHIEAKFINAAYAQAKGEIVVRGSVIQSRLRAWRVEAVEQGAEIIGGLIEAEEDVCADTFGSEIGVKTVVQLGYDLPEIAHKLEKLTEQIKQLEEKGRQCNENLEKLDRILEGGGMLSPTQEKVKQKLLDNRKKIDEAVGVRLRQIELTEEAQQRANRMTRMVRARKNFLPGVEVRILEHSFSPKTPTGPLTLCITTEGIEELPFEDRVFESEDEVDE